MRRSKAAFLTLLLAVLALVGGATALAAPARAAEPYCGIRWGSLDKSVVRPVSEIGTLANIRAGRHACFDRLVLDVAGDRPGEYSVGYVSHLVLDGSDAVLPVRGGARLEIVALLLASDESGTRLYQPANRLEAVDVSGFRTFRQVASLGNFEAIEEVGLGVRARLPFRVFVLDGPGSGSRLVVDVAHRW